MLAREGHNRFKAKIDAKTAEKMNQLKDGQAPKILFITCSDSRVCPNKITDTDIGELFVIRNAGNSLPAPEAMEGDADKATLEFAVKVINVEEIIICGHADCGAMKALCDGVDKNELPLITQYFNRLNPLKAQIEQKDLSHNEAIKLNVQMQIENLMKYDFVKSRVDSGDLSIEGWVYNIGNGELDIVK